MQIRAKFRSVCPECGDQIELGDLVNWQPGAKAEHLRCPIDVEPLPTPVELLSIPCPDNLAYLPYQIEGISFVVARFARGHNGALIADEMGLGKTVQACGVINSMSEVKSALVICPASAKFNWRAELDKWLTRTDIAVEIINYDVLKKLDSGKQYDLLILDEAHRVKNPKAQRTKHVMALKARCKRILSLTGTPILNKPLELWTTLQILDPATWDPPGRVKGEWKLEGEGAGFFSFAKRYCDAKREEIYIKGGQGATKMVWDFDGSSNLEELGERLRKGIMIRRLKADVLKDLPPKRYQVISLPSVGEQEPWDLFDVKDSFTEDNYDDIVIQAKRKIPFEELSKVRHKQALEKLPACVEHIEDVLENVSKVIIFAHHQDVIDSLAESLQAHGVKTFTGSTPEEDRVSAVTAFQNDPKIKVIIGSIGAMGVALTLTAASCVIFVELDWVPANMLQAEDRAHRIGQKESLLIQHLVMKGTLDERLTELLMIKQQIAASILVEPVKVPEEQTSLLAPSNDVPSITVEEIERIHNELRYLASRCDGAQQQDGAGFNKLDSQFGKSLSKQRTLSPKQALAARKMLVKYAGQLGRE